VVRELADLPGEAHVSRAADTANPQQLAAIEEEGVVFVSAGAGTGKTRVLVERYVRAVADRGLSAGSVLVITYTERAAGELRERVRAAFHELGREDLAREMDGAWISTIHGFCARLLRAYPFEAGLDPRFRVLDDGQASALEAEAFAEALGAFCAGREPERLALLVSYGASGLRTMLTGVFDSLRSAGRPLMLEIGPGAGLAESVANLRSVAEAAFAEATDPALRAGVELLVASVDADESPLRLRALEAPAGAPVELVDALDEVAAAALEAVAMLDRDLLQELLVGFDKAYARAKARESALDFEDLQLRASELLQREAGVRDEIRLRFRSILVDEFQDTNRLQCEIVDQIAGSDLFFVGDEFQSIYRFRHADVDVFRERRAASAGVLALRMNYRSRPEVLAVVNHLFSSEFGTQFEPLEAAGRFPGPLFGPAVELLVTDKASYKGSGTEWRKAEARHVASRILQLVDEGACEPGDVVLLFAAGTSTEAYEEALRAAGLPTYRATGRGYFGQQQVSDVLAYLRLLQNRYDDEALLSVLASPLVGVSNDALVLLREAAGRRPLFQGLERTPPPGLSERDARLMAAFLQRYERLVRASTAIGLEHLCERIVTDHEYDLAVLAHWDGRRRYANLRKLARLARSFQELRGADLEGFVRFVGEQASLGVREVEAVAEEEGGDAIRLLTIHGAKGLEFKVVVVCDAGRLGGRSTTDEILYLPNGRFGFRVADPATGKRLPVFDWDELRAAEKEADQEETRRLYYVAMTRAIDRLIVAGSIDPTRKDGIRSTVGWVLERLGADLPAGGPVEIPCGDAQLLLRVDRPSGAVASAKDAAEQLALFGAVQEPAPTPALELPPLPAIAPPPEHRVRRLSYSALALFARCPYRFYAERIVGLRPDDAAMRGEPGDGLHATEIGDAVHVLLEADASADGVDDLLAARYGTVSDSDRDRISRLVSAWHESPVGRDLASRDGVVRELPFTFAQDGVLFHGFFDAHHVDDERAIVVDYKTNRLGESSPEEIVGRDYVLQRLVYALAVLRSGVAAVDVTFVFLERPDEPVSVTFGAADEPALAAELSAAIASIHAGQFVPTPSEMACSGCPALDRVCAGPRLLSPQWEEQWTEADGAPEDGDSG
jgi:ATP-dependent exoDNAse (exonuclease V) beta subunit